MRFKKTMLVGATLALINLPVLAHADLNTTNYAPLDSAVKIVSTGKCTGPNFYTPAAVGNTPGTSSFPSTIVNLLCKASSPCAAEVYMDKNCSGTPIATAYFDLGSQTLVRVDATAGAPYSLSGIGSNNITIK